MCKEPACDHTFDYSEEIIMDNIVRGIADSESLLDLQGVPKTDRTSKKQKNSLPVKSRTMTLSAVGDSTSVTIVSNHNQRPAQMSSGAKCWA
jgi:hypothetical protein